MCRVFASGFAQRSRVGCDVQYIVYHLKSQPHSSAIFTQRLHGSSARITAAGSHQHTGLQQCAGFEAVHVMQLARR